MCLHVANDAATALYCNVAALVTTHFKSTTAAVTASYQCQTSQRVIRANLGASGQQRRGERTQRSRAGALERTGGDRCRDRSSCQLCCAEDLPATELDTVNTVEFCLIRRGPKTVLVAVSQGLGADSRQV